MRGLRFFKQKDGSKMLQQWDEDVGVWRDVPLVDKEEPDYDAELLKELDAAHDEVERLRDRLSIFLTAEQLKEL